MHLEAKGVMYIPVSTPPVLSPLQHHGSAEEPFSLHKKELTRKNRQECISIIEDIFGDGSSMHNDLIAINFFALEGWSLAELFNVRCVVAAPYVVPYSAPASFERQFKRELPHLYKYLQEAPVDKVGWKDVIHWMWPLFTEEWGSWRSFDLKLSALPFTDPVTGLPTWHYRPPSPLLLYGFSKEVVECPAYWPSKVRVCGFWFLPLEWQFSCNNCAEVSASAPRELNEKNELCSVHTRLQYFLGTSGQEPPIFISLSSVGSMGFLKDPRAFLRVLGHVMEITSHRFILLSAGYKPLDDAIKMYAQEASSGSEQTPCNEDGFFLFSSRLFSLASSVPYNWLFPRCAAAIHHGGSGSTAAALQAGIPQVICPFMLDQFYWAERMFWLGVAAEPLKREHLVPDTDDDFHVTEAAKMLAKAINHALSPQVKARALQVATALSTEDGVSEAVQNLKEELSYSKH
ncbi:sterol 3-beta-glucosyltransferase UGT80B1 isoform X2 [Ipomoea triloba]|nr:sterol 3-beta-glucosyltransferase UGT80B1 isoform X2 [Ipomoea triloba]